jgi:arylsulfatase A-like enzyme
MKNTAPWGLRTTDSASFSRRGRRLGRTLLAALRVAGFGALVAGSAGAEPQAAGRDADPRPNILLVYADDLGYGDLSAYGATEISTPHLDRLARDGARFTRHYAGSAVCAPSRAVLLTGLHSGRSRVRDNGGVLAPEDVTVAERLQSAGYATGAIGKWGLGDEDSASHPNDQGFDFFYGYLDQVLAHNSFPDHLWRDREKEALSNRPIYHETGWAAGRGSYTPHRREYSHDLFTEEALRFVSRHQARPFFLYLAYTVPHDNGEAVPFTHRFETPDTEPYADREWPYEKKAYAALVARLDRDVDRLRQQLGHLGIDDNTLILVTSDNGPVEPRDGLDFNSTAGLRGRKRDLHEGGVRVPLIAYWPGRVPAGRVSEHLCMQDDFMATACELAGVAAPTETTGLSFVPALLGGEQREREGLYWEIPAKGGQQAARMGRWKAVRQGLAKDAAAPIRLYDLEMDPGETRDVAAERPEIVERLRDFMAEQHRSSARFPRAGVVQR